MYIESYSVIVYNHNFNLRCVNYFCACSLTASIMPSVLVQLAVLLDGGATVMSLDGMQLFSSVSWQNH